MSKYTIVLPISCTNTGTSYNFVKTVGIKSYETFLDLEDLAEFIIVCPSSDTLNIQEMVSKSKIPFRIINDEHLLQSNLLAEGWFKQQIIKLAVYQHVTTDHYLVVDGDMYLTQNLSYDDLFCNGKIKYSHEAWPAGNTKLSATNTSWWESSCKIMNINPKDLHTENYLMGVTPQVLVKEYVMYLCETMRIKFGKLWQQELCDAKFTEYTLYWLFLYRLGKTHIYTTDGYPLWVNSHDHNISDYVSFQQAQIKVRKSFLIPKSHFGVVQGYLQLGYINEIISEINQLIDSNSFRAQKYDAVFLIASMLTPNRYQFFTTEQRFIQTLETVRSARAKVPNSFCLLIEGSIVPEKYAEVFNREFNACRYLGNSAIVQSYVNDKRNIGHGEFKLLQFGLGLIRDIRVRSKFMFKFGARYKLNDNFDLSKWNPNKYTFRMHIDSSINQEVYTTGLYSIPIDKLDEYNQFLIDSQAVLSTEEQICERVYRRLLPKDQIHLIDTLGLEGRLSYNGTLFSV